MILATYVGTVCQLKKTCSFQLVVESVSNIRTVVGLGREAAFLRRYRDLIRVPHRQYIRQVVVDR